ncbi:hypothetical protein H5410_029300 [Solanum commersonii]|uniref:Uncharacterized protein n=1 Tax=Solanum commersonii TaxID=4109 RepID=A0A9J5Z793_SOLCO|nr:hypothetical protein H5410_029300 [Solanum commersonii]
MRFYGDPEFHRYFYQKFTLTSVKTLVMEVIGHNSQNGLFTRSNEPQSRKTPHFANFHLRYGASWSPRPKRPIYKFKRSLEQSTRFYGDLEFQCNFCQKFTWTSVKTLVMEPIGHHGQNVPITRSNDLGST